MSLGNVSYTPGNERQLRQALVYLHRAGQVPGYQLTPFFQRYVKSGDLLLLTLAPGFSKIMAGLAGINAGEWWIGLFLGRSVVRLLVQTEDGCQGFMRINQGYSTWNSLYLATFGGGINSFG